jgi:glucokinase
MYNLVADIGGTNSRFAMCKKGDIELIEPRKYPNSEFKSLGDVMQKYIEEVQIKPSNSCLAVAGPAHLDEVRLTNIDWRFSVSDYCNKFNLSALKLTNDFTALAMSVPYLAAQNVRQIGGAQAAIPDMPISVLGPGTGLGVSGLLPNGTGGYVAIQGEGGNADFCPNSDEEIELYKMARLRLGHVRTEDFVSGSGLTLLHELRLHLNGLPEAILKAEEIAWQAKMGAGSCRDTIFTFCGMLGSFAGNHALNLGAFGGVYIGGGVAPQLEELFDSSPFRERFEAKGRFAKYVSNIPTYIMLSHSRNALIGAAAILNNNVS